MNRLLSYRFLACCALSLTLMIAPNATAQFTITAQQFDRWVFSGMKTASNARQLLDNRVEREIQRLESNVKFSEEQRDRIRLAAAGDIKRFFDDFQAARKKFIALGQVDQGKMNEAYQLAMPLSQRLNRGLFGKGSLLQKVAKTSLSNEQSGKLDERQQLLRERKTESLIRLYVCQLDNIIPMTHRQRTKLEDLVRDTAKIKDPNARYASTLLAFQVASLAESNFKSIFDAPQFETFKTNMKRAKERGAMLKGQGLINER